MIIKQTKEMTDSERIAAENSNNQYLRTLTYAPIGMIIPFGGSVIPNAFLLCDGSVLNTTEYADLFNAIGYTYGGSGDTFKIPDFVSTTLNDVSVKFIIKTANGITEKERLEILGNVDQTYNPESENAQSGKAVAQAVDGSVPKKRFNSFGAPFSSVLAINNYDPTSDGNFPSDSAYKYIDVHDVDYNGKDVESAYVYTGKIPTRGAGGNLWTGMPIDDSDCVPKKYVDDAVANAGGGGSVDLSNYYTKAEIDKIVGDIETLLGGI